MQVKPEVCGGKDLWQSYVQWWRVAGDQGVQLLPGASGEGAPRQETEQIFCGDFVAMYVTSQTFTAAA